MTIRRRCRKRNCSNGRRCLEHLQFDVMFRGMRYRMMVNEFAIPRMDPGRQRPVGSIEEARDWERRFIGEIKADGQFNVVWKTPGPVKAKPWSPYIEGNDKKPDEPVKK